MIANDTTVYNYRCHALTLVIFVSFIILVRSGCDMGDLCVLPPGSRGFVCLWGVSKSRCLWKSMVA